MPHFKDVKRTLKLERIEYPIKMMHAYPACNVGWGAHTMVGGDAKALGMKNALICTTGLKGTGIIEAIQTVLKNAGVESSVYDKVTGNPKDFEVMEGYKIFTGGGFDSLISVGGGSSHDCTKAIRLVYSHDGQDVRTFEGAFKATKPNKIPHLAINTTSGTGSEVSCFSIINHTEKKYKMALFDPACTPSKAVNDPLIHQCMSFDLTGYTGMDALTHAVEAIASRLNVESAWGPGLYAITTIFDYLRESQANRNNDLAIQKMVWAEMAACYAFNSAGLGIVHSMAHALGGLYDAPHGLCNSIGLIDVCRHNLSAAPEKYALMAHAVTGLDVSGLTAIKAGEKFIDECEKLRADLSITKKFKDLGMLAKDADALAGFAKNDICSEGNPKDIGIEEMKAVFVGCM